jgi:hypothetical protein
MQLRSSARPSILLQLSSSDHYSTIIPINSFIVRGKTQHVLQPRLAAMLKTHHVSRVALAAFRGRRGTRTPTRECASTLLQLKSKARPSTLAHIKPDAIQVKRKTLDSVLLQLRSSARPSTLMRLRSSARPSTMMQLRSNARPSTLLQLRSNARPLTVMQGRSNARPSTLL